MAENAAPVVLRLTRSGNDLSQPLTVAYATRGSAKSGVNFQALSGSVTFPAGAATASIKIQPLDDKIADGGKTLKLTLAPSANGSYVLGSLVRTKVRILNVD